MPRASDADAGYTLLEVLIVVAILSMTVAAAPTAYSAVYPNYQVRQYANDLANLVRDLRRDAIRTQQVTAMAFTEGVGAVAVTDAPTDLEPGARSIAAPDGLDISFAQTMDWKNVGDGRVEFYPSGATSGGVFEISRGGISVGVTIDWVSGSVEVEQ